MIVVEMKDVMDMFPFEIPFSVLKEQNAVVEAKKTVEKVVRCYVNHLEFPKRLEVTEDKDFCANKEEKDFKVVDEVDKIERKFKNEVFPQHVIVVEEQASSKIKEGELKSALKNGNINNPYTPTFDPHKVEIFGQLPPITKGIKFSQSAIDEKQKNNQINDIHTKELQKTIGGEEKYIESDSQKSICEEDKLKDAEKKFLMSSFIPSPDKITQGKSQIGQYSNQEAPSGKEMIKNLIGDDVLQSMVFLTKKRNFERLELKDLTFFGYLLNVCARLSNPFFIRHEERG